MPKYNVKVDLPNVMKGELIEVPPFGAFENGSAFSVELAREDAEKLGTAHGITVKTEGGKSGTETDMQKEGSVPEEPPTKRKGGER